MKEVVEFLQANPVQYLATVGRDGKAKCRPFMFCFGRIIDYGFVQIIKRMYIRICNQILILKFQYQALIMLG